MRSSTIPPRSFSSMLYWAPPGPTFDRSLVKVRCNVSSEPGPSTMTSPRWVRSNTPTDSRTARCSASVPRYSIGMSQPANGPSRAPRARCSASSGECRSSWEGVSAMRRSMAEGGSPEPSGVVAGSIRPGDGRGGFVRLDVERKDLGMADDAFDVVVLGSGTGGYATALRAAELGKRVALVERDSRLGGTCLLRG